MRVVKHRRGSRATSAEATRQRDRELAYLLGQGLSLDRLAAVATLTREQVTRRLRAMGVPEAEIAAAR